MITWETVQQGIFDGESGGDYDALFNYQNREGGIFSNVKLTDMTVDEALSFADPTGNYARYVASKNNGQIATPMGAYQIVGRTLRDAKEKLNLSGDEKLTKSLQDKIGKWIYSTQGTKAWAGYKGPKETSEGAKNMNPFQMQQMQQRQGGLMGFLRDPRTRQTLTNFSRTNIGRRLNEQATQEIATGVKKAEANATARYLDTLPNGKKYADAIRMGMPAKEILDQYRSDEGLGTDGNVQSSTALFGGGTMIVTRDGQFIVKDTNNQILKGQEAQDYIDASNAKKQKFDQETAAGKKLGQITAEKAGKIFDDIKVVNDSITNIDTAIGAIDAGGLSGFFENYLPNITQASADLTTAMNAMGLTTIAAATFGALSEAEMKFAIATSAPPDLSPGPLKEWLLKKRRTQLAARNALEQAAIYLSASGNTLEGYLKQQIENREQANADNPYMTKSLDDLLKLAQDFKDRTVTLSQTQQAQLLQAIKAKRSPD
tara:strand:- start:4432 stop:5892 length:1461 start_codon:yes stop_codon:yes gene_type:complete